MHGLIIDIRTVALGDIETIPPRFSSLSEVLLLIADKVFRASDDT